MPKASPWEIRLWSRVKIMPGNACWEWTGSKTRGYGVIGFNGGTELTHRMAWCYANGFIPIGLSILHKCDNPKCCRPDHLRIGTQADNMADMKAKGRANHLKGESHPHAKLSADQVREIRIICATQKRKASYCSRKYGISLRAIRSIMGKLSWVSLD